MKIDEMSMAKKNNKNEKNKIDEKPEEIELRVSLSEKYQSYLSKMDQSDKKQIEKALDKFKQEPRSMKMKSLKNVCDSSTISMEINGKTVPLRVMAYLEKRGNEKVLNLFWAGTHPEYDKVVARGYVIKAKLESIPSALYKGLTLSDIANETNEYKTFIKKAEVLDRIKSVEDKAGAKYESSNNSKKHKR